MTVKKHQSAPAYISILVQPDTAAIRTAEFNGQEHTVIPVVMLKEGVLSPGNSTGPELALAEEFGRFPDSWNGRPVVMDHPKMNGIAVSANSPSVLEDRSIGQLFNTKLEDKTLKSEIWVNQERVNAIGDEAKQELERLTSNDREEPVEVSTGLFVMLEESPGVYQGTKFERIWRDVVPDHLAVLPEGIIGACSVEKGCGAPRLNSEYVKHPENVHELHLRDGGMVSTLAADCECQEPKSFFQSLAERFQGMISFVFKDNAALSDRDIRTAIQTALSADEGYFFIVAVFSEGENKGTVVYEDFFEGILLSRAFEIQDGGAIVLSSEKTQVRPETRFVPVQVGEGSSQPSVQSSQPSEVIPMDKEKVVQALIDNTSTQFTDDDKEWLMTLNEEQLTKLDPVLETQEETTEETPTEVAPPVANASAKTVAKTVDQYVSDAPDEIQQVLRSGLKLQSERKSYLINGLLATKRCKFSKEALQKKPLEELETLAELADVPDFRGAGGMSYTTQSAEQDNQVPPAPIAFPVKKADAA